MEAWINGIITSVGPDWVPWVVFGLLLLSGVGIPLGEDIIIIPAGILVQQSADLHLWPMIFAAYAGVVLGDILWLTVCSKLGTRLVHKKWFKRIAHPKRMLQVKYQFDVRGVWVIVLARFIPASRTTTITVAGMMHMKFWKFALATIVCCIVTAPAQLFAGWWIASSIDKSESTIELILRLLGLVMIVIAVVWFYRLWSSHRKSGNSIPRANAAWIQHFNSKK